MILTLTYVKFLCKMYINTDSFCEETKNVFEIGDVNVIICSKHSGIYENIKDIKIIHLL